MNDDSDAGNVFQTPLSQDERILRDRFVSEYLKDFDPFHAAIRTGFQAAFALEWGKRLYQCAYVQSQITILTREPTNDDIEREKAFVKNNLRRLMVRGSEASQVAATKAYMEMNGWTKPDPTEDAEQALVDILKDFAQRAPV